MIASNVVEQLHEIADLLRGAEKLAEDDNPTDARRAATLVHLARDKVRALATAVDLNLDLAPSPQ